MDFKTKLLLSAGSLVLVQAAHLGNPFDEDIDAGAWFEVGASAWADEGEGGEGGEGGGVPTSYALNSTDPNAYNYDARAQVDTYIRGVHASYIEAAEQARRLVASVEALIATPSDDTLATARAAWIAARPSYLVTEAFRFYDGPIEKLEGRINAWPLNEAFIDSVEGKPESGLVNDASIELTIETIDGRDQIDDEANVTTGWHAIEFLLWGQDLDTAGPGNRPFTDYVAGESDNDRRRVYLKLITDQLADDLAALAVAWTPDTAGNYAATFAALPQREAIGRMMNGIAILTGFELMSERLTVALDSGDQEDEHSCFSDTTYQDFVYDLKGIRAVWDGRYHGTQGSGLNQLVDGIDAAMAAKIDALFDNAEMKVAALGDPWDQVLAAPAGSPARLNAEAAVAALGALAKGLKEAGVHLGVLVQIPSSGGE